MSDGIRAAPGTPATVPLFPINGVLFPGEPMPLQIFEPRYLQLLDDLEGREPGDRQIGFVAIRHGHEVGEGRSGELASVGCLARLLSAERHPEMEAELWVILALGVRRFRLDNVTTESPSPYLMGEVTLGRSIQDDPTFAVASEDPSLRALETAVLAEYTAYARTLGASEARLPEGGDGLAFRVAAGSGFTLADQLNVLAAETTHERLRLVRDLLRRERALVTAFGALPGGIRPGSESPN